MNTVAKHLLVEFHDCDAAILNDRAQLEALMRRAGDAAAARVVAAVFHPYSPQGIAGGLVVGESPFSVHTWPEYGYAAMDFYTCGQCQPERAAEVLGEGVRAARVEVLTVERGLRDALPSFRIGRQ